MLKKIKLESAVSMLSSKTEGAGNTTSWMYWTRYVWCIFANNSELVMGITSLNLAKCFRYCLCRLGTGQLGSYSRHPTTSKIVSSAKRNKHNYLTLWKLFYHWQDQPLYSILQKVWPLKPLNAKEVEYFNRTDFIKPTTNFKEKN